MRKLGTKEIADAKRKRNTLILSIFMLFILVGGTAGYAFISNPNPSTPEQGIPSESGKAQLVGNRWVINTDNRQFSLTHSPESVSDTPIEVTLSTTTYRGLPLYIVSDNNAVNSEIASVLGQYASKIQLACHGPCEEDLPEKDCSENLIIWKDSPENKIYREDNCVFIEGDLRAVDALLYKVLGINS